MKGNMSVNAIINAVRTLRLAKRLNTGVGAGAGVRTALMVYAGKLVDLVQRRRPCDGSGQLGCERTLTASHHG